MKRQIQFYNEALEFARLKNSAEKIMLAISRLENPYQLAEQDRAMYHNYLTRMAYRVVPQFIDAKKLAVFPMLVKYRVIKKSNIARLVEYAQRTRRLDILSYLLNVSNDFRTRPRQMNIVPPYAPGQVEAAAQQALPDYAHLHTGDIVWLGTPPMPWEVLEKKNGEAFLISKYMFDCQPYSTIYKRVNWRQSSLRGWLNKTFMENAFSEQERALLHPVYIGEQDDTLSLEEKEGAVCDRVFLLSMEEAGHYFKDDEARRARLTHYAAQKTMWTSFDEFGRWWLRSPSADEIGGTYVRDDGTVYNHGGTILSNGYDEYFDHYGVRPAICLNLGQSQ